MEEKSLTQLSEEAVHAHEMYIDFLHEHSREMTDQEKLKYPDEHGVYVYDKMRGRMLVLTMEQLSETKMLERYWVTKYGKFFKAEDAEHKTTV